MKSIPRLLGRARPNDGITPPAGAVPQRVPSWPRHAAGADYTPLNLPPENPFLLRAFPYPVDEYGTFRRRPSCLILGASRTEHERQRRTAALADALAYEAAVAENTLILHPDDATAAAYLDLLHAALPVATDRPALPLEVTR